MQAYPQAAQGIAFSPDGRVLAVGAGSYDAPPPVRLLDARTLTPLAVQPGHQPVGPVKVVDLAYSADGRHLAVSVLHDDAHPPASTTGTGDAPTSAEILVWDVDHLGRGPGRCRSRRRSRTPSRSAPTDARSTAAAPWRPTTSRTATCCGPAATW